MKLKDITAKPVFCRACFKEYYPSPISRLIFKEQWLCDECISKIIKKLEYKKVNDIKTLFLSDYDGILKNWLMNFKEYRDVELAPCFLYVFLPFIRLAFPSSLFVPLPSSNKRIASRGFSHLSLMLKESHLPYKEIFTMEKEEEQKNKFYSERSKVKGISLSCSTDEIQGKRIVLFDDVMTSGSTFLACYELIKNAKVKKISGMILLDNYQKGKLSYQH